MTRDGETRDRLLDAAEALFSARGFKDVTVREICRDARANVAAVNYHFGDKLGLYTEVLRRAAAVMRSATESAATLGRGKPPGERLALSVRAYLELLVTPGHERLHRLVNREVQDPSPALDTVVEQAVRPRLEHLAAIVSEVMGKPADDPRVMRCVGSIQAQTLIYLPNPIATRLGFRFEPTARHIDEAARHITEFSMAGIRAMKRVTTRDISDARHPRHLLRGQARGEPQSR